MVPTSIRSLVEESRALINHSRHVDGESLSATTHPEHLNCSKGHHAFRRLRQLNGYPPEAQNCGEESPDNQVPPGRRERVHHAGEQSRPQPRHFTAARTSTQPRNTKCFPISQRATIFMPASNTVKHPEPTRSRYIVPPLSVDCIVELGEQVVDFTRTGSSNLGFSNRCFRIHLVPRPPKHH